MFHRGEANGADVLLSPGAGPGYRGAGEEHAMVIHGRWTAVAVVVWVLMAGGAARGQSVAAMSMREFRSPGVKDVQSRAKVPPRTEEEHNARAGFVPVVGEEIVEEAPPRPEPGSFWEGWEGSVEGGVNGSSGNSENFNVRMGFGATRRVESMETSLDGTYTWATDAGEKTKSRGDLNARNDWSLGESAWFVFAVGKVEYDEFQDWRWRFSAIVGPGYALVRDEVTTLKLRGGIGVSRELGGSRNELIPELDLGVDFEHKLTERQSIFLTHDTYPSVEDFADFRTVTKAGWEIVVDPEVNLLLKLGIEHRHQSEPGEGFKENDVDYFAVVGWRF